MGVQRLKVFKAKNAKTTQVRLSTAWCQFNVSLEKTLTGDKKQLVTISVNNPVDRN